MKYKKPIKLNLKNLPIGTIIIFSTDAKGIVVKPSRIKRFVRFEKSVKMTLFSSGDKWDCYADGYLDAEVAEIIKPKLKK